MDYSKLNADSEMLREAARAMKLKINKAKLEASKQSAQNNIKTTNELDADRPTDN